MRRGTIELKGSKWAITVPPHVMIRLKNVFPRVNTAEHGTVHLKDSPLICKDLLWFMQRHPIDVPPNLMRRLRRGERTYDQQATDVLEILSGAIAPKQRNLALTPRKYQGVATEVYLVRKALLLADTMGLGKTGSAIASFTDTRTLPALIVAKPNLTAQLNREVRKWLPDTKTFIIENTKVAPIPKGTEVIITSYTRLSAWAESLATHINSIVFDEMQELRHRGTDKYRAARYLTRKIKEREGWLIGLTGSPIYNYGDEMFSLMDLLEEGCLGSIEEFFHEQCTNTGNHYKVIDPISLGLQLRDQGLLLRRTREDVALELPPRTKVVETIETNTKVLTDSKDRAIELAQLIMNGATFNEKGIAAREFDLKLRQATGIAKAPAVAAYARIFLEQGEKVIIFAWHREVYTILQTHLAEFHPVLYTGTESPKEKEANIKKFASDESSVMLMSLRSSEGTDGLQAHCHVVIHGELDWSGEVHEQGFCRVYRPGQEKACLEVFLVEENGSDPTIAAINGVKRAQSEGILNPESKPGTAVETDIGRVRRMAEEFLKRNGALPAPAAPAPELALA